MDEMVVSAALRIWHHSRVKNVFRVPLAHKYIVKKMPMFGPRTHQNCYQAIFLLEDCNGNAKLVLSAKLEQELPIIIAAKNAVPTKEFLSDH